MAYEEYKNSQNWPEDTNFYFQPQQVVNPPQTDSFKMHHDDGLDDLLFLSSGTTNAETFTGQSVPVEGDYGVSSCDMFDSTAVGPQEWSLEAPGFPQSESFVSPDVIVEPSQPTDLAKEVEMTSVEDQPPTKALEMIEQKTIAVVPSGGTQLVPDQDMAPIIETEMALAKDKDEPSQSEVMLAKEMHSLVESDPFLAKSMVPPTEREAAAVNDVILPEETDAPSANDDVLLPTKAEASLPQEVLLPEETEIAPGKDVMSLKEAEIAPCLKVDSGPQDDKLPPKETEIVSATGMVSLSEAEASLEMGTASATEKFSAEEIASTSETEVVLERDMTLSPDTTQVALPIESLVKVLTPSPEREVALLPEAKVNQVEDIHPPEMELNKDVTIPPETVMNLRDDTIPPPEKEVASVKDLPLSPETEGALVKDVGLSPGTEVMTLANDVTPAKNVAPPTETEVVGKDVDMAQTGGGISMDAQLGSPQHEKPSPERSSPTTSCVISAEPGQKYNLPTDDNSTSEKLEQKEPLSQPSELPSETSGTSLTPGKPVCRPSDRRAVRSRPARVPSELQGGSPLWKIPDPRLGPCPFSELGWVSGPYNEPGKQRQSIDADFLGSQKEPEREGWDVEDMPMMVKKKKKKPKQKRYPQPRGGGHWENDNSSELKCHPFAAGPPKSGVSPSHPPTAGSEYAPVPKDTLQSECAGDSSVTKQVGENLTSESLKLASRPEGSPKRAVSARVEEEGEGNKSVPERQAKQLPKQSEFKAEPASHPKTPVDSSHTVDPFSLKGPLEEGSAHRVETPLKIKPKEDGSPVLEQEVKDRVSKPTAAKELPKTQLPKTVSILPANDPLAHSAAAGRDESETIKVQNVNQKKSPEGTQEAKVTKEAFPKQREEINILASEPKDPGLMQAAGPGDEPLKRMMGESKSRKGKGSSGKVRVTSGKGRAKSEVPFLLGNERDGRAAHRPVPNIEMRTTDDKREEQRVHSRAITGLGKPGLMGVPREMADPELGSTPQELIALENRSSLTPTSEARTEREATVKHVGVSNQSKEGMCPWPDPESTPWISEKSKKRGHEGKHKKAKSNYPIQPARMEGQGVILSLPFGAKEDGVAGSISHQNEELGLIAPKRHEPGFSHTSDISTMQVVYKKRENIDSPVPEPAIKGTDQIQGAASVPSIVTQENKIDVTERHTAVADETNKRNNDGTCKEVKNSSPKKHFLGTKTDAAKIHVPMETTGDHRIEGLGYVDENRNITFTCLEIPAGLVNKSVPLEALQSTACEKQPKPTAEVVHRDDDLPDTSTQSGQERAPAQTSQLLEETCNKDGVPGPERQEAPPTVGPSTSTEGVCLTFPAEPVNSRGDECSKSKGELADSRKNETGINEGRVVRESESVHDGATKHSIQKIAEPAKGPFIPGVPPVAQSLQGEVRMQETLADRSDLPVFPLNEEEHKKGPVPAQHPDLMADKAQKLSFSEAQKVKNKDFSSPESLNKEEERTGFPEKSEKATLKELNVACQDTTLECSSMQTQLQPEVPPSGQMGQVLVTASEALPLPELKENTTEEPPKMTEKSEPKILGEGKKEDKTRMAEPLKGYMRPTKSRGLTPPVPKPTSQERERAKPTKSSGNEPAVCLWHQKGLKKKKKKKLV